MNHLAVLVSATVLASSLTLTRSTSVLEPQKPELRQLRQDNWLLSIPTSWRQEGKDDLLFIGPDRANVLINVRPLDQPLMSLIKSTRRDLTKNLNRYQLRWERGVYQDAAPSAWLWWGEYQHQGIPVAVMTAVFEGGDVKVVLTLSVKVSELGRNPRWFMDVLRSVEVEPKSRD